MKKAVEVAVLFVIFLSEFSLYSSAEGVFDVRKHLCTVSRHVSPIFLMLLICDFGII